jgi:hypothetical protein
MTAFITGYIALGVIVLALVAAAGRALQQNREGRASLLIAATITIVGLAAFYAVLLGEVSP